MLAFIVILLIIGLIAGAIARLLLPGRDPIGLLGTIVVGVIGSFLGSFAGAAIFQFTKAPDGAVRAGWGALLGRMWATVSPDQSKTRSESQ